jgi:iron(III) transport system substrate-binding protein
MRSLMVAIAAAALAAAACQPAPRPAAPAATQAGPTESASSALTPEVQRLLAAARDAGETELTVSWSANSLGGLEGAKRYEALFNRMYGTSIKITLTPGPSMVDMMAKITQEVAGGQKASSDLLLQAEGGYADLLKREVMEPYDYTRLSPRITPEIVAAGNLGVEIYSTINAILYNTDLIPRAEAPRTLEDVLQPKWKGKVASTPYATGFDRVTMRPEWGAERMKAYVTRLSDQIGGLLRLSEESRVVSGEFHMLVLGNSHAGRELKAKGAPIEFVIPEDAAVAGFLHLGVPRNSGHPNLAKLFANVVVSEEGQKLLFELYHADHHELPGSQAAAEMSEMRARGVRLFGVDAGIVSEHPEIGQISNDLSKILTEKRGG